MLHLLGIAALIIVWIAVAASLTSSAITRILYNKSAGLTIVQLVAFMSLSAALKPLLSLLN